MDIIVMKASRGFVLTMIPYAFSQSVEFLALALGFWYGSRLLASYEYDTTQFFVVFIAVVFGFQAAGQFFGYTTSITKAKAAANYILWLRTVESKITETPENKDKEPGDQDGPIEMENVEFRYIQRADARVLRGIDIKIEPGTYCAFVGPSGCGKSTLVALLERFYDPSSGRITLDHEDIAAMSPRLYRDYISMVQQEPPLYQGTVRENIAIGLQYEPSDEEINEACRQSNALDSCRHYQRVWRHSAAPKAPVSLEGRNNESLLREPLFASHVYCCWTRRLLLWTRRVRGSYRRRSTKRHRAERPLRSLTD
jgi:ATP-binding cassette subfamily B (MDR/TAP) protein 1